MTGLKGLIKKRKEVAAAVASKETQRQNMIERREKLLQPEPSGSFSKAKALFDDIMRRFLAGEAGEAEAIAAKRKCDEAGKERPAREELADYLADSIQEMSRELRLLQDAYIDADKAAWLALSDSLVQQIKENSAFKLLVHQAHTARCKGRDMDISFRHFCEELFQDRELDRSRQMTADMEKKYLS
jgi:hypothetical protein